MTFDPYKDLTQWTPCPFPSAAVLEGAYCRLERLDAVKHGDDLFKASSGEGANDRFRYLFENAPQTRTEYQVWLDTMSTATDPFFYAVIDKATGRAVGRQSLMRITPEHGVIEIGHILWGREMARTRLATEAFFLTVDYAFQLGYRRVEWKCHSLNMPSRQAALRFGFHYEGLFRNHMIFKGHSRDTTWFAMTDHDWLSLRAGFVQWLSADNFDDQGQQRSSLGACLKTES